ncbi:hypothetical protein [Parasutterella excrementihominis]|jgi:hypothetical protein|uniref:hypothetical protein n=1 Tax=Parasutterella excrementihominis TaxID=487175 RepID=UPI003520E6E8
MLKSLIQLFAEKFLQSKKSWVGNQSLPSSTKVAFTATNGLEYTAPADGWVRIGSQSVTSATLYASVASLSSGDGSALCYVPVRKGEVVVCYISPYTGQTDGFFIPAVGSS